MGEVLGQIGMQAAGAAIGGIGGQIFGAMNDRRQLKQQKALTAMQMNADKEMTAYNKDVQLQMWRDTSYGPQKEQMEKAGINPALMYGMGGGGGQTANISSGNVGGGRASGNTGENVAMAGMGMMGAAQLRLMKEQADNLNADTQDKLANLPVKDENRIEKELSNTWEKWKQTHDEEGYLIEGGKKYDKDDKLLGDGKTWKEKENRMLFDKEFNIIDGIIKSNALTEENYKKTIEQTAEIGQHIELMKKQGLNVEQVTKNLEQDELIKKFEVKMNNVGLTSGSISDIIKMLLQKVFR